VRSTPPLIAEGPEGERDRRAGGDAARRGELAEARVEGDVEHGVVVQPVVVDDQPDRGVHVAAHREVKDDGVDRRLHDPAVAQLDARARLELGDELGRLAVGDAREVGADRHLERPERARVRSLERLNATASATSAALSSCGRDVPAGGVVLEPHDQRIPVARHARVARGDRLQPHLTRAVRRVREPRGPVDDRRAALPGRLAAEVHVAGPALQLLLGAMAARRLQRRDVVPASCSVTMSGRC
jgi:hypothetical protein